MRIKRKGFRDIYKLVRGKKGSGESKGTRNNTRFNKKKSKN